MSNDYGKLLSIPYTKGFVVTGLVGRLPMSMLGISGILLVTSTVGSYTLAGMLSGSLLLAQSLTAAQRGRLVDRWGQRRVLLPIVLAHTGALTAILLCCLLHGPELLLLAFGFVAGTTFPSIGALVRSRWTDILSGPQAPPGAPALSVALSLESAIDELVYILGPLLATLLATSITGAAGFVGAMACTLVGGVLFATRKGGGDPHPRPAADSGSVLRIGGIRVVAAVCVALGTILGAVEATIVAYTKEHGHTGLSGPIVAAFSVGSLIAGLGYGSRTWRGNAANRFVLAIACVLVGMVPVMLAPNMGLLTAGVVVAGIALAPALIGAHELIQELVPAEKITEGYSWVQTTVGLGLGIGVSAAGTVTDRYGAHTSFLIAGAAAVLAVLMSLPFRRVLARAATPVQYRGTHRRAAWVPRHAIRGGQVR
ncbi:MFS transporter [Actinocatenispora sera]|uniref:MFS transporter n=1 Tax=Actinocatenispora sera TaxID=390989 RepID=A0A810KRY0_9ACTN|nr:MFS transporter [Actinocatenispora sera]BCJ25953.1 MFS transporter [Actinocatenispora sera]